MLEDIIFLSMMVVIVLGILILLFWDDFKCDHNWKVMHDTKYDNVGFRDKYPVILVCAKCGKVKVIK